MSKRPSVRELRNGPIFLQEAFNELRDAFLSSQIVDSEYSRTADVAGGRILIPRNVAGSGGSSSDSAILHVGFGWYSAPYLGTGDPPANQGLKIQLYEGEINGHVVPDNMGSVFTLTNNADSFLCCTTTQTAAGEVTSAMLSVETTLADDPDGAEDVAPATSIRPLWKFTTVDNAITLAVAKRLGGLDVSAFPYAMDCGHVSLRMFWSAGMAIG